MDSFFYTNYTNLFIILKSLNVILIGGLIILGVHNFKNRSQKITFTLMLLFLLASSLFFNEEGMSHTWLKHILFIFGQIFFYFFISNIITVYLKNQNSARELLSSEIKNTSTNSSPPPINHSGMAAGFTLGSGNWFTFATEQGLQHILVVPIFFLIITIIRVQFLLINSLSFRKTLNFFIYASTSMLMIHVSEFFIESQGFFSSAKNVIEYIEVVWFYIGIAFFLLAIRKLSLIKQ